MARRSKRVRATPCPVCLYRNTQLLQVPDVGLVYRCLDCHHEWPHKGPLPQPRTPLP